jgi:hypothetical protein
MNAESVAVIIAAGAQAASVILGIGQLTQKLADVREDMREIRSSLQSCLQILVIANRAPAPAPKETHDQNP